MLIYLYIVKRLKQKKVASTLAPGSRGEAQFFLIYLEYTLRVFVKLIYITLGDACDAMRIRCRGP